MSDSKAPRRRLAPDERRAEILQAAAAIFDETPYELVTISDVARASGASRSLIVHYFEDKAGLFRAAAISMLGELALTVATNPQLGPLARVDANIDALLRFAQRHRESVLALIGPGPAAPELRELVDAVRDRIVDRMLVNHAGTLDVPPGTRFALRAFTGLVAVALGDWLRTGEPSREELRAFLRRSLLSILRDVLPDAPTVRAAG